MRKDILKILGVTAEGKENVGSANQVTTSAEGSTWLDGIQNLARKTAVAAAKLISDDPVANAIDQAAELLQNSSSDHLSSHEQRRVVEIFLDAYANYPKNSTYGQFNHLLYMLRVANGNNADVKNNDLINALRTLKSENALEDDNFIAVIKAADPLREVDSIILEVTKERSPYESQRESSSEESAFRERDTSFDDESITPFKWPSSVEAKSEESVDQTYSSELENEIKALEERGNQILKLREKKDYKKFVLLAAQWQKEYNQFKAANNIDAGNVGEYPSLEKLSSRFLSMGKRFVEIRNVQENRKKESRLGSEPVVSFRRSSDDLPPLPALPEDSEEEMSEQSESVEKAALSSKKRSKKLPYIVDAENLINDSDDILKMMESDPSDQLFQALENEVEQWESRVMDWQMGYITEVSGKSLQKYQNIDVILQQRLDLLKEKLAQNAISDELGKRESKSASLGVSSAEEKMSQAFDGKLAEVRTKLNSNPPLKADDINRISRILKTLTKIEQVEGLEKRIQKLQGESLQNFVASLKQSVKEVGLQTNAVLSLNSRLDKILNSESPMETKYETLLKIEGEILAAQSNLRQPVKESRQEDDPGADIGKLIQNYDTEKGREAAAKLGKDTYSDDALSKVRDGLAEEVLSKVDLKARAERLLERVGKVNVKKNYEYDMEYIHKELKDLKGKISVLEKTHPSNSNVENAKRCVAQIDQKIVANEAQRNKSIFALAAEKVTSVINTARRDEGKTSASVETQASSKPERSPREILKRFAKKIKPDKASQLESKPAESKPVAWAKPADKNDAPPTSGANKSSGKQ